MHGLMLLPLRMLLTAAAAAPEPDADPASFPLSARIFGTIRGINGKLGFTNPLTGQPEVGGSCCWSGLGVGPWDA